MVVSLSIEEFLEKARQWPVIDVRSPGEYVQGHIPGAVNVCLFNDEERAMVGKLYHEKGPTEAVNTGMLLVNPKLAQFVEQAVSVAPDKKVLVHCWRGGIRSESFAFLLETSGFEVYTLQGGYKSYRREVIGGCHEAAPVIILGGMTGSGKTRYLKMLAEQGIQTIDLESIACHKGSVFGAVGQKPQPTSEQFQNEVFHQWSRLDLNEIIVMEDENMDIGSVSLTTRLFYRLRTAPVIHLIAGRSQRAELLVEEYSSDHDEELKTAVRRIERRLGNEQMKKTLSAIDHKEYKAAAEILLVYYDKAYQTNIEKRPPGKVFSLQISGDAAETAQRITTMMLEIGRSFYRLHD
jgi:tRNA 2-selenouridine synthase